MGTVGFWEILFSMLMILLTSIGFVGCSHAIDGEGIQGFEYESRIFIGNKSEEGSKTQSDFAMPDSWHSYGSEGKSDAEPVGPPASTGDGT